MLLLYFVAAGLLAGLALGGRLDALAAVRFAWAPVAVAGLLFQAALFSDPFAARVGHAGPALYVLSTLAVLVAVLRNRSLPGFRVIAFGAALNFVAIVTNGGLMPASPEAFEALTGRAVVPAEVFSNSTLALAGSHFAFLGDVFVLPRPFPFANVFSFGDVLIGLGAAFFLVRSLAAPSEQRSVGRPSTPPTARLGAAMGSAARRPAPRTVRCADA